MIEHDLKVTDPDNGVYYVSKYEGTPEFYVYDEDGEQVGWGKNEDAFMDWLTSREFCCEPIHHSETPMGPK